MGLSSDNKQFHGFRSESNGNPPKDSNSFRSSEAGMGWEGRGRGSRYKEWKPEKVEQQAWSERRADLFRWAESHLPDQHPALVVVAIIAIRMGGEKPTKERVLDRLRATGREASQIGYGPGGYAA